MPKAIIFDWDNTLVDTWPFIHQVFNYTLKTMGYKEWTLDETKEKVNKSLRGCFPDLFGDRWEEAIQVFSEYSLKSHLDHLKPLPHAENTLKYLHSKEIPIFLVSNKLAHKLHREVAHLGWEGYFTKSLGAGETENDKPHREPVDIVLQNINIDKHVWFVGDSIVDLECACNAGVNPVLFGDADHNHPKFKPYKPFTYIKSHIELVNKLELFT